MKLSTERILTTHVGSLARPPDLFDMLAARASGQPYDAAAFETMCQIRRDGAAQIGPPQLQALETLASQRLCQAADDGFNLGKFGHCLL